MKVKGLSALLRFSRQLRESPRASRQAEEAIMRDWKERAEQGFDKETDPYGNRWKPRQNPTGSPVLTGPTRKLRRLKLIRLTGYRWAIVTAGKAYVGFHQRGTKFLPRRRVFPDEGRLPASWREAGRVIYRQKMREHFER